MDGIDVVFHQAAIRITQCAEEPALAIDVLVNGTFNVLEAARRRATSGRWSPRRPRRSTAWPIGFRPTSSITRTTTARSTAARRRSTKACCASFHDQHGLDYVALRYFNVYGPRMDMHGAYTEVFIRWMERIASQPAVDDLRRRHADDGLHLRG